jgi:hypothetical protein
MANRHQLSALELANLEQSVLGDLLWLQNDDLAAVDEAHLRELSAKLRRLLVEGTLQQLRKAQGIRGEPKITSSAFPLEPGSIISQSGGMTRGQMTVGGFQGFNRAMSPEEIKSRFEAWRDSPKTRVQTLSNWLSSSCMTVGKVAVSRRIVIQYVANKLGGVHLDPKRNPAKDAAYIALDDARNGVRVLDLDLVYGELTAIGQQLRDSKEVRELTKGLAPRTRINAPNDGGDS